MNKYSSINVGDSAQLSHTISQQDVEHFIALTGDDNKLHHDEDFAKTTVFKKPISHGMLGVSFISTIIGTKLPGDGALWFAQSLEFLLPVRVGDTITVVAEVLNKFDREQIIELKTNIFNQHKQIVTAGVAKVKVTEQQEPHPQRETKDRENVALIIGATGGIGHAICSQLAADGYDIAIHFLSNSSAASALRDSIVTSGSKCISCSADITDEYQVADLINQVSRKLGAPTLLVNCATIKIPTIKFSSLDWEDMQSHININVKGMFNLAKYIVPIFESQSYGKIITFTTQAIETPSAGWLPYIAAKSALDGFSKALAVEVAPKGITVNIVSPGMTETELIADIPVKNRLMVAAKTPLRRLASPDDIAGIVGFLASPKADYLTGETIRVNGGQVMV